VTVYGEAIVAGEGTALADRCRALHLVNNPQYAQFIVGDGIAIVCVRPTLARICNVQDRVTTWANHAKRPLRSEGASASTANAALAAAGLARASEDGGSADSGAGGAATAAGAADR
jgi:hypothetical protein